MYQKFWSYLKFLGLIVNLLVSASSVNQRTNFVIFLADDLGIGDVGCFGNITMRTPGIDSIAKKGARLDHHLTAAAVCTPSRAALLTGRYPVRQGMESSGLNKVLLFLATTGGLPSNETTFAKLLQKKGYSTALIGKWHLGLDCETYGDGCHHPNKHGFDYYYGVPLTNLKDFGEDGNSVVTTYTPRLFPILTAIMLLGITLSIFALKSRKPGLTCLCLIALILLPGLAGMFALSFKKLNSVLLRNNEVVEQPIRLSGLTQRLVREAKDFLSQQAENENSTPFLLVFSFIHVHTALFTAPGFAGKSQHGHYGDNVEELDWAVQQVLFHLREEDLADDTFVYFSSDNGAHIEERGLTGEQEGGYNGQFKGGKCMGGMEGGIRVPSAVMWPGRIPEGVTINTPTSQMDLFPTILQIAGISEPKNRVVDGKSLVPLLLRKDLKEEHLHHHRFLFHYCGTYIHAARYVDDSHTIWKVHFASPNWLPGTYRCHYVCQCYDSVTHDVPLIFNLSEDPYEDKPLNASTDSHVSTVLDIIRVAVKNHMATVDEVPSQFNFVNSLWRPWLQPCCNFPYCTCTDEAHSQ